MLTKVLIITWVDVFDGNEVVDSFDNMREATKEYDKHEYELKWAAAERIDEKGNLNFPVYANTKRDAVAELKKVSKK